MRFWDSSALVPLIVDEPSSDLMKRHLTDDRDIVVWWGTPVECVSALTRRALAGEVEEQEVLNALIRLDKLESSWEEVVPSRPIRALARRLLRVHSLRAADALQLAAALSASEGAPGTLEILTLDERLKQAAGREGLRTI